MVIQNSSSMVLLSIEQCLSATVLYSYSQEPSTPPTTTHTDRLCCSNARSACAASAMKIPNTATLASPFNIALSLSLSSWESNKSRNSKRPQLPALDEAHSAPSNAANSTSLGPRPSQGLIPRVATNYPIHPASQYII